MNRQNSKSQRSQRAVYGRNVLVNLERKCSVDEKNSRIAIKTYGGTDCTTIGSTPLPLNKVTSWNIKILNSSESDGYGIYIVVAKSERK